MRHDTEPEIAIDGKNWWLLIPFVLLVAGLLLYRSCDRTSEVERVRPFVTALGDESPLVVGEALLEIRKAGLYAEPFIERIVSLLGDERRLPGELQRRTDFGDAVPVPRGFESLADDADVGDLAAAALVSIGSSSSGGLLYSESGRQIRIQRRISGALRPILRNGTSGQKQDAMRVINITRVEENLPVLAGLLKDDDPRVRALALGLYISYAPLFDVSPYRHEIEALTRDDDEAVRIVATEVLAILGKRP
jgi:HEAT repeat protein